MIVDKLENSHLYAALSPALAKAFEILKDNKLAEKSDGKYDVDGDKLYYIVQRYVTKPLEQGRLEAHRKYIDVQFIAAGRESVGFSSLDNLKVAEPYNETNDIIFYKVTKGITTISLKEGMFCIFFPHDAHMPSRQINGPSNVTKVVIKVKTDVR